MSFSKLKSMIILVLVLTNLFLLVLFIPRYQATRQAESEVRLALIARFENAGITLSNAALAEDKTLYPLLVTLDEDEMVAAASALLGEQVLAERDSGRYLTTFSSSGGTCHFYRNGSFSATLTERSSVSDVAADAEAVLKSMGFSGTIASPTGNAAVQTVVATWQVLHTPVRTATLTLTYRQNTLVEISGQFLTGLDHLQRLRDTSCMSNADALTAFFGARSELGWVGSSVTDLTLCYMQTGSLDAGIPLQPVWIVTTDTGSFLIDGESGTVTAE